MGRYRIISISEQNPGIKIFRMEPERGKIPGFKSGQFAFIHLLDPTGSSTLKRPYSIASTPSDSYLEFCIKMVNGRMTGALDKLVVGSSLGVALPFGNFSYSGEGKAVLIAGGSGIAPMIGILREIAKSKKDGSFMLFYSVKSRGAVIYKDELSRLQATNPCIKVIITLTQETPSGWEGECGRINELMLKKHVGTPSSFDWWICGPLLLIKGIKECATAMGADPKKIRVEGWG